MESTEIAFVVGQTDAGGAADVIVASAVNRIQLASFNGKDGRQKWAWSGPEHLGWYVPADVRGLTPQVLASLDGTGRRSICLPVHDRRSGTYQVLIVGPQGRERHRLDLQPMPRKGGAFRLWNHDLDGDGKEELLFVGDGKVRAIKVLNGGHQPPEKCLWEWPLPNGPGDILGIQPAGKEGPAVVVVRSGSTAYALDGPTGQLRWRCDGPGRPTALWPGSDGSGLPGVLFHVPEPEATVCRQAVRVDPGGTYRQPPPVPIEYGPPSDSSFAHPNPAIGSKGRG
jgi:hypothetical protein